MELVVAIPLGRREDEEDAGGQPDEDETQEQVTQFHGDAFGWGLTKESFEAGPAWLAAPIGTPHLAKRPSGVETA